MKLFNKVEDFFEKFIEGFFNKKFSSGLQPVEIAKRLCHVMESQKSVGILNIYVPNHYLVYLNRDDFEKLSPYGQAIRDEIAAFLAKEANRKNYTIIGQTIIDLYFDEKLSLGRFRVDCEFTEPIVEQQSPVEYQQPVFSDTRVFDKVDITQDKTHSICFLGTLTVIEGLDAGSKIDITGNRINIGRREGNELPLTDMNTSRLHAYVVCEDGDNIVYDAKSLNGTYVNGHRIAHKKLQHGDHIKVGNTVIVYEVK